MEEKKRRGGVKIGGIEPEYNDKFDIPSLCEEGMYHNVFCRMYVSEGDEDMDSCTTCIHFQECIKKK